MRQGIKLVIIFGLLSVLVTGCVRTETPGEAVYRYITGETAVRPTQNFRVLKSIPSRYGVLMLYRTRGAPNSSIERFGYIFVKQVGFGWQIGEEGNIERKVSLPNEQFVEYGVGGGLDRNANYALVYGQALNAQVAAVEATFNNRQVVRDNLSDTGFILFATGANDVCELRVLGKEGQLLQRINSFPLISSQQGTFQKNNCSS